MTIFEKTRELGEMIQNCDEMKKAKAAEAAQAEDETAQALMKEYNLTRLNLARDMQSGKISKDEAIKKNEEAFKEICEKSESIRNFIDSKKEFDAVVNQINQILNYYITGHDPSCSCGDCSSCSGCH